MAPVKGFALPPFPSFEEFLRCPTVAVLTMTNLTT